MPGEGFAGEVHVFEFAIDYDESDIEVAVFGY